ncbi:MAG: cytochrome c biogenesis protein CcdA [Vicinamibacterales bacterium]
MVRRLGVAAAVAAALLAVAAASYAQENPVKWAASSETATVKPGQSFRVSFVATLDEGWHIYSMTQPPPPIATRISVAKNQPYVLDGTVQGPPAETVHDPSFGIDAEYYSGVSEFIVPVKAAENAASGKMPVKVQAYFQSCNDQFCLPPKTVTVEVPMEIAGGKEPQTASAEGVTPSGPPAAGQAKPLAPGRAEESPGAPSPGVSSSQAPPKVLQPQSAAPADTGAAGAVAEGSTVAGRNVPDAAADAPAAARSSAGRGEGGALAGPGDPAGQASGSLWSFLWLAMTMGAVSLLTPCVFPMVPITVSYFTKHAGGSRGKAVGQAATYMAGIILTFTAIGMAMALLVGATSLNRFAASPWVNLAITIIFIAFALNLFGFYEIRIPSGLLTRLDSMTRQKGSGSGGETVATLLMALTFTLTSFTCTAPFIGTLLVMAAGGQWQWPLLGMLAYSAVFALPFFLLALVPKWLSSLPRSGGWMNSVKVMMAFVVVAASTKFLSNVDVVLGWGIFTRDVVLGTWVTVALMMMAYVLGMFRFQHDSPVKHVGMVRLATGLLCGTLAFWLASGLTGKPLGEIDSLLPLPQSGSVASAGAQSGELAWFVNDYEAALAEAQRTNRRVFIDFTGYTCTNCKWMESNMFTRPTVQREFRNFVLVKLYTDGEGEVYERQQQIQQARYRTVAVPYYAIVEPDGEPVVSFAGLTRDEGEFIAFLRRGVEAGRIVEMRP